MNKNGNYHLFLSVFYRTMILVGKTLGKKLDEKSFPRMVRNFGNLAVQELPFRLKYRAFGSLMTDHSLCYGNAPLP